jgi:hypothetical protein
VSFTTIALITIQHHLSDVLDPDLYDAEELTDELHDLVMEAEDRAWAAASPEVMKLMQAESIDIQAIEAVLRRHGLDR